MSPSPRRLRDPRASRPSPPPCRYGDAVPANVTERIEYELGVIEQMGFPGYFLVVADICRYARVLTKERPLYAVMGGFHLNGPLFEPLIPHVLDDLGAMTPSVVVPAHCTGWRAQHAIGARFGEAFIPNTVGTRFDL